MEKKPRRILTEKEIKQLRAMAQYRVPRKQMAAIIGISESTLERCLKRDAAAREELEKGRAIASSGVRQKAYDLAMSGNVTMLIFWLKTQEGFKETDRLELTGDDGGPVKFKDLTREQRKERLDKLMAILDKTKDE